MIGNLKQSINSYVEASKPVLVIDCTWKAKSVLDVLITHSDFITMNYILS